MIYRNRISRTLTRYEIEQSRIMVRKNINGICFSNNKQKILMQQLVRAANELMFFFYYYKYRIPSLKWIALKFQICSSEAHKDIISAIKFSKNWLRI